MPFLIGRLGITKSAMGLVIVMFGLGSVAAMALLAVVLPRTGSRLPAFIASALTSFFVLALTLTPTYAATLLIAPVLSAVVGVASVALNAQVVECERRAGRTFMSSFHGFWSMGILIGSIVGGIVADGVGPLPHVWMVVAAGLDATAVALPRLLHDRGGAGANGKGNVLVLAGEMNEPNSNAKEVNDGVRSRARASSSTVPPPYRCSG